MLHKQAVLIPLSDSEKLAAVHRALIEHGKHSLYCCWVHKLGIYDRDLICTCGLAEAIQVAEG